MKRFNKLTSWVLVLAMSATVCACSKPTHVKDIKKVDETKHDADSTEITDQTETVPESSITESSESNPYSGDYTAMTMFIASPLNGAEKTADNDIKMAIAEKTGVVLNEEWLDTSEIPEEVVGSMIENDELPDFIDGINSNRELYNGGYLVAWDNYLEKYPNLKELYSEEEWNRFRQDDGKIYWANVFGNSFETDTSTVHDTSAFWIQARVLEAYGYPKITTLDEYFELLEMFASEYPELPDGTPIVPYTCLFEDWRVFSIENAPELVAGYSENYMFAIDDTDSDAPKVVDYNLSPTTEEYFRKMNEEYNKGNIDPDFCVQTFDEYIEKLSTGAVLGINDQYWNFDYLISGAFATERVATDGSTFTLDELGCGYIPLGLTIEPDTEQHYHSYTHNIDVATGVAVTTSCENPDLAFAFLNALLDQEIHDLRFWGIRGVDYLVDDNGINYRTEEMRNNWADASYLSRHTCEYSFMPQWRGMHRDGVNRMMPEEQPGEFMATLPRAVADCFAAYGVTNYVEMLGSEQEEVYLWFPQVWSDNLMPGDVGYDAYRELYVMHRIWYPSLIISEDFESDWAAYVEEYSAIGAESFFDAAQAELDNRVQNAKANGWIG